MSSGEESKTIELLLRSFLSSEKGHREQQVKEHEVINRSISNMSSAVADAGSKLIQLDTTINLKFKQQDEKIGGLTKRLEDVEEKVSDVSDETGRHELTAVQVELERQKEIVKNYDESKRHWGRWAIAAIVTAGITLGGIYLGYELGHNNARAATAVDHKVP